MVSLASVGTYSGPVGTILLPIVQGAQLWVKHINAKGGLHGHPVKLAVYDDGGDPARHSALVQQAVERERVQAFLINASPFTPASAAEYIRQKRIPVIGISTSEPFAYNNPMYFPQASSSSYLYKTFGPPVFAQIKSRQKTKLATLHCIESPECANAEKAIADAAPGAGVELVYRGKASLGQPDFTAECLAASRAGAQALYVVLDQNSAGRVAAACARQGYKPTYAVSNPGIADSLKENPLLNGAVAGVTTFPWFQSDTGSTAEFQLARRNFGSGLPNGSATAMGWTAGKILEKAGANLPEPPTTAAILEGLWSIHDDDLGGITSPLTFLRDQPAKPTACYFAITISDGTWVSPDRFTKHCL